MSIFWISVGMGLAVAAILALSAVAFTLEYAVSRVVNLAHGEVLTIGAYAAYVAENTFHQSIYVCAAVATIFGADRRRSEFLPHRTIQKSEVPVNSHCDTRRVAHSSKSPVDWLWWRQRVVRIRARQPPARRTVLLDDAHD